MSNKEIYTNLMRKAEEAGDVEIADHYLEKLLIEEAKSEGTIIAWILLGTFIITLIAPFLTAFL